MVFEWDETKRDEVIKKHRVDFVYAAQIFLGPTTSVIDDRVNYGEARTISVGMVGNEVFVVVHTLRGEAVRLISAWKGGRNDQRKYQDCLARGNPSNDGEG
jgi:uncharacterized protein